AQTVNINSADAEELAAAIKGVGQKSAHAIVAYRQQHGPFRSVEELAKVKGIGQATIDKNRASLSVGRQIERQARQE
ncbi:MAG: ComEA family DNA-binding protein, partial [Gammaproteobacteria bacterium]